MRRRTSQEALRITGELDGGHREPARVRELLTQLTGKPIDESVTVFPLFHADLGKNITLGTRVFIISGCTFQDQGGVVIGDDCLIGHSTVLATLNHDLVLSRRADMHPAPIVIGNNVWIGSHTTVLPSAPLKPPRRCATGSPSAYRLVTNVLLSSNSRL